MSKEQVARKRLSYFVSGAVGAAVIPIPVADTVAITSIQLAMLYWLINNIYERDIGKSTIRSIVTAAMTQGAGMFLWSLVKTIPGIGTIGGAIGQMLIAGTLTAALGLAVIEILEEGGDLSVKDVIKLMKKKKGEAKTFAKDIVKDYQNNVSDIKKVNFKCLTGEVEDTLVLTFNAHAHNNTRIEIVNMKGEVLHTHTVNGKNQRIDMPFGKYEIGSYSAVFKADGIKDIILFFVKL